MQGRIIKSLSGEYDVLLDGNVIVCKPLGIFRHKNLAPKVGDVVEVKGNKITKVADRKNDFVRPNIANIDKVFILTSFVEPDFNTNLLDRLIALSEWNDVSIVLGMTKADLVDIADYEYLIEYYKNLGYPVYILPYESKKIIKEIDDHICVVAGQSGVGKSSMINLFDANFQIATNAISQALGRGKHTTRHVELLPVGTGWIADTPGFGILDLDMDLFSLSHTFREFFAAKCKFAQCLHIQEPGCQVLALLKQGSILQSRYDNYRLFLEEIKNQRKY